MNLVLQHPHTNACQQACIAMLANRTLDEVIRDAGTDGRLGYGIRKKLLNSYGIYEPGFTHPARTFAHDSIGQLMRSHETLWVSVFSVIDANYGHACILHKREIYDPSDGMNPSWPWHRVMATLTPLGMPDTSS